MTSRERRRKHLARQKYERQQERRAQARRKTRVRNSVVAAAVAVALVAGATAAAVSALADGDGAENTGARNTGVRNADSADSTSKGAGDSAADAAVGKAADPCDKPAAGKPGRKQWSKEPEMSIDTAAAHTLTLATTCGEIGVELDAGKAPRTVNSIDFLAGEGYFDHTRCHRLVNEGIHVLQCGDPTGTGQGGPGYTIPDENLTDPRVKGNTYPAGTVAMANQYNAQSSKGRDSGGSQFFLVYQDSPLPPDYTPFGRISEGMDVLRKIAKAGSSPDPRTGNTAPNATVVINKATVTEG